MPPLRGNEIVMSPWHPNSIGQFLTATNWIASSGAAVWPAANQAWLIPFVLERPATVYKIGWVNGGVASGNIDAGVYDAAGTLLISTGSTAQGTVSVYQEVDVADTALPARAVLYMAMAIDNITARMTRFNPDTGAAAAMGVRQKTSSFVLPSTLTGTSDPNVAYVPCPIFMLRNI
jgi:hypothetical protein